MDGLLTAIAIDGKRLRGVPDGQVKLVAAMLHQEKAVIAQPELQRAVFGAIQRDCPRDYTELDRGHGRIIRRPLRAAGAGDGIAFPPARQVARTRRDRYDASGALISKEIMHAITSQDQDPASAADLAPVRRLPTPAAQFDAVCRSSGIADTYPKIRTCLEGTACLAEGQWKRVTRMAGNRKQWLNRARAFLAVRTTVMTTVSRRGECLHVRRSWLRRHRPG